MFKRPAAQFNYLRTRTAFTLYVRNEVNIQNFLSIVLEEVNILHPFPFFFLGALYPSVLLIRRGGSFFSASFLFLSLHGVRLFPSLSSFSLLLPFGSASLKASLLTNPSSCVLWRERSINGWRFGSSIFPSTLPTDVNRKMSPWFWQQHLSFHPTHCTDDYLRLQASLVGGEK